MRVLAIDQGTTNTKAVLVDDQGRVLASASAALTTDYPRPGWAEQSAMSIWTSVRDVIGQIVRSEGVPDAIGIANQRETLVVWDAGTAQPICPALIWQCRRTAESCAALIAAGHDAEVVAATGLGINPLFPASKLAWVFAHVPQARALHEQGMLRAGTVDTWLLWCLTAGASFATDHSNASRMQLFDTRNLQFSAGLGRIFGVPTDCLPTPHASDSEFGETAAGVTDLPAGVPVLAMMGDSHAALYGHGVRAPGQVKATYGTGSSLMTLTPTRVNSAHGLSGTIAWSTAAGPVYALEGNITVSAQAASFMAGLMGVADPAALSALAQTVPDTGGVCFVPALAGLGAPHWDDAARGLLAGMTLSTTRAHVARATFEAIAQQVADVFDAMGRDVGQPPERIRADGGASGNPFLMQLQADMLGCPVQTADIAEIGALGVAAMAFGNLGVDMPLPAPAQTYSPRLSADIRASRRTAWQQAIQRAGFTP
ncbi:FGGY family carbohydrate kinase [Roseinatronobacter alkalisoli]|uniref:ATP:glycerol 3-phosphotransferase n=1 Tax=Roseinatronobacter alkalisoli TaxID=3028235 RepID=A0ABT5T924_9RHOB|nr:FGGY family carbohydrate kinase [Roseinatronobacter sp. HJB301]MDD7970876.1 FGGY family carbohydrate kinase [Roseinatronobacter sp. HJB301]